MSNRKWQNPKQKHHPGNRGAKRKWRNSGGTLGKAMNWRVGTLALTRHENKLNETQVRLIRAEQMIKTGESGETGGCAQNLRETQHKIHAGVWKHLIHLNLKPWQFYDMIFIHFVVECDFSHRIAYTYCKWLLLDPKMISIKLTWENDLAPFQNGRCFLFHLLHQRERGGRTRCHFILWVRNFPNHFWGRLEKKYVIWQRKST